MWFWSLLARGDFCVGSVRWGHCCGRWSELRGDHFSEVRNTLVVNRGHSLVAVRRSVSSRRGR